jgi:hypothetical protein
MKSYGIEKHHVVYRKQAKYMENIKANFIYLCAEHYRGNNGPHRNRQTDLKYKQELQTKYYVMFPKNYYKIEDIMKILECSEVQARHICKVIRLEKEGYPKEQIIFRMMGERFYQGGKYG